MIVVRQTRHSVFENPKLSYCAVQQQIYYIQLFSSGKIRPALSFDNVVTFARFIFLSAYCIHLFTHDLHAYCPHQPFSCIQSSVSNPT